MLLIRRRYQPNKPLPNKRIYIKIMRETEQELKEICSRKDLPIEDIKYFCKKIQDLEFEFPFSKLEPLQKLVKDLIEEVN